MNAGTVFFSQHFGRLGKRIVIFGGWTSNSSDSSITQRSPTSPPGNFRVPTSASPGAGVSKSPVATMSDHDLLHLFSEFILTLFGKEDDRVLSSVQARAENFRHSGIQFKEAIALASRQGRAPRDQAEHLPKENSLARFPTLIPGRFLGRNLRRVASRVPRFPEVGGFFVTHSGTLSAPSSGYGQSERPGRDRGSWRPPFHTSGSEPDPM